MITLDLFESEPNKKASKQNGQFTGRIERPAIAGTDKTAKSGYYPKPADPVKKLAQPTKQFDKVTKEGVAQRSLKEIGDTPAGQAALRAVGQRADDTMAAWAANPKSGYSSTPSAVAKASQAGVAASNRQYGFGLDKSKVNTVMARDALRQQQAQRGMAESMPQSVMRIKKKLAALSAQDFASRFADKSDEELRSMARRHGYGQNLDFYVNKKNQGQHSKDKSAELDEAAKIPYPEGSQNLGLANMELLTRAYNEPTSPRTTLYFGDKIVDLDRQDVEAIADYYHDKLPDNAARWNFVRAAMNNYDNFLAVLHKIGRRSASDVRQPGLFQEADKKKDDDDLGAVKDVALQRAITKAKADFPTAGSGLEALAKDFMKSQEQDRKEFDQLQSAERRHDQLLSQISTIDQEQEREINDLESQNSVLSQRLQQLQNVNAELAKKLSAMTGRGEKRQAVKLDPSDFAAPAVTMPTMPARKIKGKAKQQQPKKQATPRSKDIKVRPSTAIDTVARQLALPGPPPRLPAPNGMEILPPEIRRPISPELLRGKETATDIDVIDRTAAQKSAAQATIENTKPSNKDEADYGDEYQAMVRRVGQLAKAGPLKTVWDPVEKVYKVVPVNQIKNVKEHEPSVQGRGAIKNVNDWAERLEAAHELEKDLDLMSNPEARLAVQQQVKELLAYGIEQGYFK